MPDHPPSFAPFARLPYELRDAIWAASLPARLVYCCFDHPLAADNPAATRCRAVRAFPSVAHACAHARAVARRSGRWVVCPRHPARPVWVDRARDTLLLPDAEHLFAMAPPWTVARMAHRPPPVSAPAAAATAAHCFHAFGPTAGGLAVSSAIVQGRYSWRVLLHLLQPRDGDGDGDGAGNTPPFFTPLLIYYDELYLHGPRAAAVASGLFHLPHAPLPPAAAGRRPAWQAWRLVPLDDTATLRRMQAFSQAMEQHARYARHADAVVGGDDEKDAEPPLGRVDGNAGFFRTLLQPTHRARNAQVLENTCSAAAGRVAPAMLAQLRQSQQALMVVFDADD